MHRYRVLIHWTHRKWGPRTEKLAAEGTSARRALNAALLGFFSDRSNRENRRDAHQHLTAEIWRLPKGTATPADRHVLRTVRAATPKAPTKTAPATASGTAPEASSPAPAPNISQRRRPSKR